MLLEAVRHFRSVQSVVMDSGSLGTTAHAHQCCIFQSYAKTVPSQMKLTMILTMREPASMTTDKGSRRETSYSNSVLEIIGISLFMLVCLQLKSLFNSKLACETGGS